MSASVDLSRVPRYDARTVRLARRLSLLITGVMAAMAVLLAGFAFLDAQRFGETAGLWPVPALILVLAMIPLVNWGWSAATRQAVRMDLDPTGISFLRDDGTVRRFSWNGPARELLWIDGRMTVWPRLRAGWPRTHVRSPPASLVVILPEDAFDLALDTARRRGLRVERQPLLEKMPMYRGNAVYRFLANS